jgi:hypothetical protein
MVMDTDTDKDTEKDSNTEMNKNMDVNPITYINLWYKDYCSSVFEQFDSQNPIVAFSPIHFT